VGKQGGWNMWGKVRRKTLETRRLEHENDIGLDQ
jgi:hypothetical protein